MGGDHWWDWKPENCQGRVVEVWAQTKPQKLVQEGAEHGEVNGDDGEHGGVNGDKEEVKSVEPQDCLQSG